MEHQNIRSHLDLLIEKYDKDLIFSHILNCLSPSYIISSSSVSDAFACLLSRASTDELSKLLPDNVAQSASSLTVPTDSPPVISLPLSKIACDLSPCQTVNFREDEDLKPYAEKYWKIKEEATLSNRTEHDPARRFTYLSNEESKIPRHQEVLHCRERLVKVLKENERQVASERIKAELSKARNWTDTKVQTHTNQWLANQLNLDVLEAKKLSQMWRKYVALIVEFGPGILRVLGGVKSDWLSISLTDLSILCVFIRKYRRDLILSAEACNVEMAAALAYGMMISGFPVESFDTCQSTITVIIMTLVEVCADGIIRKRTTARDRESTQVVVTLESKEKVEKAADELYRKYIKESEKTSKTEKRSRKRRRSSCHEPSSAQHHPNRSNESRPNRTRSESDTIDEEVTAASTHDLSAETQPDPFSTVQVSLAGTEESPGPSVSRGRTAISTGESTPEVYGSGVMTSEATSFNVSDHWISSRATDYNSQFQLVNNELSPEQADLCPSTFRSPQIASAVSAHQEPAPQDPESLRHPVQYSQGTETYRNCAYYAQLPIAATPQPDHGLDASVSAQFQHSAVAREPLDGSSNPESNNFAALQSSYNGFPNSYDFGNSQQSFNGFPNSYEFTSSPQSYNDFPNSYDFRNSQQSFKSFPNSYEFAGIPQFYNNFPNSYDSFTGFESNVT